VSDLCFEEKIPLFVFFFLCSDTRFDRSVDPADPAFEHIFKILLKNKAVVGLHPSYYTFADPSLLKKEMVVIKQHLKNSVFASRQHYLRFHIRTTPKQLSDAGISCDFTMGFAGRVGYRAGTAYPFYYYHFEKEAGGKLLFVPFCAMDGAYTVYGKTTVEAAAEELEEMVARQSKTGGVFCTVFHERSFYDHLYPGFGSLYKKLHLRLSPSSPT